MTLLDKEESLPDTWTKGGFDTNAYKLMENASYDFNNPVVLEQVVDMETYDLNKTQKKIQEQGGLVTVSYTHLTLPTKRIV